MHIFCVALMFFGAGLLAYSTFDYCRVLLFMKCQTYNERIFNHWLYGVSFVMMFLFYVGYILFGLKISYEEYYIDHFVISLIFFFVAVFVLSMVRVQRIMSSIIINKTFETIQSMVDAMEAKDLYTKGHSEHVCRLVGLIYRNLPAKKKSAINLIKLQDAAILHDIGKLGISDEILNKPGALTKEEYDTVKHHPQQGKDILDKTSYRDISDWILYHHERIDGKGYYGVPENAIPLESKIIAVADTFSALFTDRVYRPKYSFEDSIRILNENAGTQLDAQLVEVFCSIPSEDIIDASETALGGWHSKGLPTGSARAVRDFFLGKVYFRKIL